MLNSPVLHFHGKKKKNEKQALVQLLQVLYLSCPYLCRVLDILQVYQKD